MAKKNSKSTKKLTGIGAFLTLVLSLAALCLGLFLSNVNQTTWAANNAVGTSGIMGAILGFGFSKTVPSGGDIPEWATFPGVKPSTVDGNTVYTAPSHTGVMILFILMAAALILTILALLFKKSKFGALLLVVAGLCLVASGIMAFFPMQMCGFEDKITNVLNLKSGVEYSLGIGSILGGCFGCVGGVLGTGVGAVALLK